MGQHDKDTASVNRHKETWELLPWYANGTLGQQELDKVEQHLRVCSQCREELARCQQLATSVQCAEDIPVSSASKQFAKLSAQLESVVGNSYTKNDSAYRAPKLVRLHDWLDRMSWGVRWALAGQATLILLLSGALVWQAVPNSAGPLYQTLSSPNQTNHQAVLQLRVIFAADTMEPEIRALLLDLGGRIVDGPSSFGAYAVEVPLPDDSAEIASKLPSKLRAHPAVTLAEPIHTR